MCLIVLQFTDTPVHMRFITWNEKERKKENISILEIFRYGIEFELHIFFSNEHSSIINALDGTRKITLQFIYMFYTQTIFRLSTFIILKAETLTFFSLSIQLWLAVAEDGFSFENVGQTWYGLKSVPPLPQFTVLYFEP